MHVELAKTTNHHQKGRIYRAEVNVQVPGEMLRAEHIDDDLYKAIDMVHDEMLGVLKRVKEKKRAKNKRNAQRLSL